MDESERIAAEYLRSVGFVDIKYEPDGNVPPDFLVEGRIAVEVRRLNQNAVTVDGKTEGLEETFFPLWQRMGRYLPTLGPSTGGECWYIGVDFNRPLESWQIVEPKIRSALLAFMAAPSRVPRTIAITEHLTIDLFSAGRSYDSFFVLGGGSDDDSGGFVIAEVRRNLELCITEKELKIEPFRKKYDEWWLVLPDHIGHGLDIEDRRHFQLLPPVRHRWAKVVLVNPHNPSHGFEV
jgi:hypothetical protein